jgi:hypothetical protein
MCIILIGKITREQFDQALSENRDGFSLYTKEEGLVKAPTKKIVEKVLKEQQFGIWHFRIGTSGTIDKDDPTNIHPFEICGGKYLLYHNGIIGKGDGKRSDTHCLADTLMDATFETACNVVRNFAGMSNRFVIVNAKDVTDYRIFGNWVSDIGVLMSHTMNYSWRRGSYNYSKPTTYSKPDDKVWYDIDFNKGDKNEMLTGITLNEGLKAKDVVRRWLCERMTGIYAKGKEVIYSYRTLCTTKEEIPELQKPKNKKFTETLLRLFDKDELDIKYKVTPHKQSKLSNLPFTLDDDDDDPFETEDM